MPRCQTGLTHQSEFMVICWLVDLGIHEPQWPADQCIQSRRVGCENRLVAVMPSPGTKQKKQCGYCFNISRINLFGIQKNVPHINRVFILDTGLIEVNVCVHYSPSSRCAAFHILSVCVCLCVSVFVCAWVCAYD